MTINDMRENFRMLLANVGQRENAVDALARRINRSLMLFDNRLYELVSGDYVDLGTSGTDARELAQAAARLLKNSTLDMECVLLLLPPSEFLVSPVVMPGLAPDAMRAALKLQAITQLPEYERNLELSLTMGSGADNSGHAVAWWIPAARTNELFKAFEDQSMFLAAVLPRPVWLLETMQRSLHQQTLSVQDIDQQMLTLLGFVKAQTAEDSGVRLQCLQTSVADLQDASITGSWQQEVARAGLDHLDYQMGSGDDYMRLCRQYSLQEIKPALALSAVFPAGALTARHQLDRGRRRGLALKAVAAMLALITLPFIYQVWKLGSLDRELQDIRTLSADARVNQTAVRDFETQWGVLTEFPNQDVAATMLELQRLINPGALSVFQINEGFISIEGESQDPQNILELLEQNPMFTEVDFARATNNNRYSIDLRLTTVNFPVYQEWHFPVRR